MVPKTVAFRDALPKSENGKIDRRGIAVHELAAVS
jgi:acyl-coenzyme A synthetase/AMP-(fatty) acid ligase